MQANPTQYDQANAESIDPRSVWAYWLLSRFQAMGWFVPGREQSFALMASSILPMYRRWLRESLRLLEKENLVGADGDTWSVHASRSVSMDLVQASWRAQREVWNDEGKGAYVVLLEATLGELPAILTGTMRATDVLFRRGAVDGVEGVYRDNPVSDLFNEILTRELMSYLEARIAVDAGTSLRILEVGAGTGGTTAGLLRALGRRARHVREYCYTDVSRAFINHGARRFGSEHSFLTTAILDIERPLDEQDVAAERYDVVVATNVLHATRDMRRTLAQCHALLRPNGILLINEMIGGSPYLHLTFGLLEGWWRYEDDPLRIEGCPGMLPETWATVLQESGFRRVAFPARDKHHRGQQVIVAQRDAKGATHPPDRMQGPSARVYVRDIVANVLHVPAARLDPEEPLHSYGMDSILSTQLAGRLGEDFPELDSTAVFEHRTIDALATYIESHHAARLCEISGSAAAMPVEAAAPLLPPKVLPSAPTVSSIAPRPALALEGGVNSWRPIAIVGMSARFAGAADVSTYWDNLLAGVCSIGEIPRSRWNWRAHFEADPAEAIRQRKASSRWGGFVDGIGQFDAAFFGMTPVDARHVDPQELHLLEQCWLALEDAGIAPGALDEATREGAGVFAAITKQYAAPETSYASLVNRISFQMDFRGKSLAIDSMCSSALAAVLEACEYLQDKGRLALVGGVNLYLHPSSFAKLTAARCVDLGPVCRAFGAGGEGFVPGEGVGAVVLKPLDDALRDGDPVQAVIRGGALYQTGRSAGYMVSDPSRQARAITGALAVAGVDAASIGYVEAAANGSEMGDAIEFSAIRRAYAGSPASIVGQRFIGSVKPNIGHCEAAAGLSQIIKVVMSMRTRTLAPTLVPSQSNPKIDFAAAPFALVTDVMPWQPLELDGRPVPRRAGISAVGGGGVNVHLVLEEHIDSRPFPPPSVGRDIFMLSADSSTQLAEHAALWANRLRDVEPARFSTVLRTLREGREHRSHRLAIVVSDMADLVDQLSEWGEHQTPTASCMVGNLNEQRLVFSGRFLTLATALDAFDLAKLWIVGNAMPASHMDEGFVRHVSGLPTSTFARKPVWKSPFAVNDEEPEPETARRNIGKAEAFYSLSTLEASNEYREEYLTLCPFPEIEPGFSMTRVFIQKDHHPEQFALMQKRQIELRQVLFAGLDFAGMRRVFDIGCGMGTDVIQLAMQFPHLRTEGYTITASQALLGVERIGRSGLTERAFIHHRDSAVDTFPGDHDLIIGIEVICHIPNKAAVFRNIASGLADDGQVVLMDFIANGRGRISAPEIAIDIATREEWGRLLAEAGLLIDSLIDVSPQVANFLYDPELEANIAGLPEVAQASFRNFANSYLSLKRGWTSYCLFRLRLAPSMTVQARHEHNVQRLSDPIPYPQALAQMLREGSAVYPHPDRARAGQAEPELVCIPAREGRNAVRELIADICSEVLGLDRVELSPSTNFRSLGVNSLHAFALMERINIALDLALPSNTIFEYETMDRLCTVIGAAKEASVAPKVGTVSTGKPKCPDLPSYLSVLGTGATALKPQVLTVPGWGIVEVLSAGERDSVVLIPGMGMAGSVFRELAAHMARHYRIIVFHCPGIGASEVVGDVTIERAADCLLATLETIGAESTHMVGWSFGGLIAQQAALKKPRFVSSLVLLNTFATYRRSASIEGPASSMRSLYETDLDHAFAGTSPASLAAREELSDLLSASRALLPKHAMGYLEAMMRYDASAELPGLTVPTLVLTGALDHFHDPRNGDELAALIPNAQRISIEGAGHAPFLSHPAAVEDALTLFFTSLSVVSKESE